jgi:excisionase family DNA binding protein
MGEKRNLSTFDVAQLLEVDPGSVANWIDSGLLKAYRTPGGHRRVSVEDLVRFLRQHQMPIPARLQDRRACVVVVDDEPAAAAMIAEAVKTAHPEYEVVQAHDGFRAGSLVAALTPEVVILDLGMPGLDGFEVCRLIKSQEATGHATVIAVTTCPSEESRRRILDCGASLCLTKPLDLNELIAQVESAMGMTRR